MLYFQSLLWISMPLYPFGGVLAALLMWCNFKWEKVRDSAWVNCNSVT